MSRYIDADALMERAEQYLKSYNDMYEAMESGYTDEERDAVDAQRCTATGFVALIHDAPTVDAVPVEWIESYVKWLRKREIQFAPVAIETMLSYYKDLQAYCDSCGERRTDG